MEDYLEKFEGLDRDVVVEVANVAGRAMYRINAAE